MPKQPRTTASLAVRYGMKTILHTGMKRNTGIAGREYGGAKAPIGLSKRFALEIRHHVVYSNSGANGSVRETISRSQERSRCLATSNVALIQTVMSSS